MKRYFQEKVIRGEKERIYNWGLLSNVLACGLVLFIFALFTSGAYLIAAILVPFALFFSYVAVTVARVYPWRE